MQQALSYNELDFEDKNSYNVQQINKPGYVILQTETIGTKGQKNIKAN